jgi:hypothetical protein
MTPYEMEEQIKNLDVRTTAIEHILPTLATKDDLRLTTAALQHKIETGFEAAKAHADRLNEVTREQIRIVADQVALIARQMATKGELQQLQQTLSGQMASKRDLQQLQQTLSAQIAALGASRSNKKR